MKTININTSTGINTFLFPDKQPHVNLQGLEEGEKVKVVCSITDANTLMYLIECSNALDNLFCKKEVLVIPYLMGARFDRVMERGDSFDLKVIAELINSCGFKKIVLFDVHSDVSTALIKNSFVITNEILVKSYNIPNSVLICPDAGAEKKIKNYFSWNNNFTDVVYCIKERDLSTGKIKSIKVLEPEKCENRMCVIVDDLCDGGGTFLGIAGKINAYELRLIVTHGVFSKGTKILTDIKFHEVITSDSIYKGNDPSVTVIKFSV